MVNPSPIGDGLLACSLPGVYTPYPCPMGRRIIQLIGLICGGAGCVKMHGDLIRCTVPHACLAGSMVNSVSCETDAMANSAYLHRDRYRNGIPHVYCPYLCCYYCMLWLCDSYSVCQRIFTFAPWEHVVFGLVISLMSLLTCALSLFLSVSFASYVATIA